MSSDDFDGMLQKKVTVKFMLTLMAAAISVIATPFGTLAWKTYADDREGIHVAGEMASEALVISKSNDRRLIELADALEELAVAISKLAEGQAVSSQVVQRNADDIQRLAQLIRDDQIRTNAQFQEILRRLPND